MTDLAKLDTEGVERVLAVVAHPDDMEYGASAAVAKWAAEGIEVHYLLLTSGEAGIASIEPDRTAALRAEEQQAACDIVGAASLEILGFPDGLLEPDHSVRKAIVRKIREVRPQMAISLTWELEVGFGINHVDHRACGMALMDAIRDADNPWIFQDLGLKRWKVERALFCAATNPTHYVDVSGGPLRKGIASLAAHEQYLAALPDHPTPEEINRGVTEEAGRRLGIEAALPVREVRL